MIDFDDTASLNIPMFTGIWDLLNISGFQPMICTSRSKDDPTNHEITDNFDSNLVIFCEGFQKLDFIREWTTIKSEDIAFWIDNDALSIPEINDVRDLADTEL